MCVFQRFLFAEIYVCLIRVKIGATLVMYLMATVVIFHKLLEMDDNNAKPSGTSNRTKVQNERKKKAPGIEWDYAINIGDEFIDWQCKLCHASKSSDQNQVVHLV